MSENIVRQLSTRLANSLLPMGGWGYSLNSPFSAESTSLACIALAGLDAHRDAVDLGLKRLAAIQRENGAVPVYEGLTEPCWTTATAMLAWRTSDKMHRRPQFEEYIARSLRWLLDSKGEQFKGSPKIYGHNTQLAGWPWAERTHSWVEPTALALLALTAGGRKDHSRYREGIALLLDRAIPGGGWNYGNSKMFGNVLRPFPASTAIALLALQDYADDSRVRSGLTYLETELPLVRAPWSLAWGLIALETCKRCPAEGDRWIEECFRGIKPRPPKPIHDAMLLLACQRRPFPGLSEE